MERGRRAGLEHRFADEHRLPGRPVAHLRGRRCQHRSHARRDAGEDGAVSRARCSICVASKGGQGKAHTLNHGIRTILGGGLGRGRDDHGRRRALRAHDAAPHGAPSRRPRGRRRHGLREGGQPAAATSLSRFIAFEYITAQAAARRAQNVMGGLACMAGGAQLHSRENLMAIGGAIDTSTLAEDTYTTIKTQLAGRRVVVRRQRRRLGRGARQRGRALEAAHPLGTRQLADHQRRSAVCGSGPTGTRCSATSPSAFCGSASP